MGDLDPHFLWEEEEEAKFVGRERRRRRMAGNFPSSSFLLLPGNGKGGGGGGGMGVLNGKPRLRQPKKEEIPAAAARLLSHTHALASERERGKKCIKKIKKETNFPLFVGQGKRKIIFL